LPERDRLARRVATFGLHENDLEAEASISREVWPQLMATLIDQRLTGFAVAAAEEGSLSLSSEQAEELLVGHRNAMLQVLALERHLVTLSKALEDAGVEMVLLKGSALAHTVYPDPSWRPFADLDFLVRGEDFQHACEVIADGGFRRGLPEPRAGFDVRFGKAAELTMEGGPTIDLHRTLVVGPFGLWLDLDELFAGTAPFTVGGRVIRRLDDSSLLLHACLHASLGWWPPLLMPVRDVAQVTSYAKVDWDVVAERTRRWRLAAVVRHAFKTAQDRLGAPVPEEARAVLAIQPRRKERRALEAYTTDRRQRGGTAISTLRAIPGLRAKTAYVRALLFPNRDFLGARDLKGRGSYLRRLAIPVRWLTGKRRRVS
jgi:putative nucleotidyltransferase-like protein